MRKIVFDVADDGKKVKIETEGFKGNACETEVKSIIASLEKRGIKSTVGDIKKKREYYAQQSGVSTGAR